MTRRLAPALAAAMAALIAAGGAPGVSAQGAGVATQGDRPIEVYADQGIEWDQKAQRYVARGNAKAIQGDTTVYADTLTAHYEEAEGRGTEIVRIEATGGVRIVSANQTAYGGKGVYDMRKGVLVLTGGNLRLVTRTEIITARDSLEFHEKRNLAVARGNAVARPAPKAEGRDGGRGDRTVRADMLAATFRGEGRKDAAAGGEGRRLERMDAFGNVVVTRSGETARGAQGAYFPDRDIANLWGKVRITRGDNQFNGEQAEVNFRTGISRILADRDSPVRALIQPEEKGDEPGEKRINSGERKN